MSKNKKMDTVNSLQQNVTTVQTHPETLGEVSLREENATYSLSLEARGSHVYRWKQWIHDITGYNAVSDFTHQICRHY